MNSPDQDEKQTDNMEMPRQQAPACGAGCDCHTGGPMGRKRLLLGTLVLLIAVALVARAVIKTHGAQDQPDAAAFALPAAAQTPATDSVSPTPAAEAANTPDSLPAREIEALAELNTVAAANDAVFVYIPGKDGSSGNPPTAAMKSTADRIESQGYKIGVFTLKAGTQDHNLIAAQMAVPGVVAGFKGRGMIPISGDITETKLIQGFVAAANAGGCGPAGCAPGECK